MFGVLGQSRIMSWLQPNPGKKTTSAAWSWSRTQLFPYELGEKISELKELMHENHKRYVNIQMLSFIQNFHVEVSFESN